MAFLRVSSASIEMDTEKPSDMCNFTWNMRIECPDTLHLDPDWLSHEGASGQKLKCIGTSSGGKPQSARSEGGSWV